MADWLSQINRALIVVGADTIPDLDDKSSKNANKVKALLPEERDFIISLHPWNFSTDWFALNGSAITDNPEWTHAYPFKSDPKAFFLRIFEANTHELGAWGVSRRRVMAKQSGPLLVKAGVRVDDPQLWDPQAKFLLAIRIAAMANPHISGRRTKTQDLWKLYSDHLPDARSIDGLEGAGPEFEESSFLSSRN